MQCFQMNEKQKLAYETVLSGKNVFITGKGGTGKGYVIKKFINDHRSSKIGVTGMTGVAASLIGGTTLHSFLGISLGTAPVSTLCKTIFKTQYLKDRWNALSILIVDEISMLSIELFEKLEHVARNLKGSDKPFGGIQLVFIGDFLQIPPIGSIQFCFESKVWEECNFTTIYLTEIVRQSDRLFQNCLNMIRIGRITDEIKVVLDKCKNKKFKNVDILPTLLYVKNRDIDEINNSKLFALKSKKYIKYEAHYFNIKKKDLEKYKKYTAESVTLCVGAQVMLLKNIDTEFGLVNGSRGVIIDFVDTGDGHFPVVKFTNNHTQIIGYEYMNMAEKKGGNIFNSKDNDTDPTIAYIPLRLAWAISVNKSQGSTLDCIQVSLRDTFDYAQVYVALSRVKNLESLSIIDINYKSILAHPKAVEFYKSISVDDTEFIYFVLYDSLPFPTAGNHNQIHYMICDYIN